METHVFNFYFFIVGDVKHLMFKTLVLFLVFGSSFQLLYSLIYYMVWLLFIFRNPLVTDSLEEGSTTSSRPLGLPHRVLLFLVALHKKYVYLCHISIK